MCWSGATCLPTDGCIMSYHCKDPIKCVGLVHIEYHHMSLKSNLFTPWYSRTITHFALSINKITNLHCLFLVVELHMWLRERQTQNNITKNPSNVLQCTIKQWFRNVGLGNGDGFYFSNTHSSPLRPYV